MEFSLLGLMEMFVVLAFGVGWAVLELIGLRLDKKRRETVERPPPPER